MVASSAAKLDGGAGGPEAIQAWDGAAGAEGQAAAPGGPLSIQPSGCTGGGVSEGGAG